MKLKGKIIIKGQFETLTGLHIGGSKSALAIGGIDNSVIKTAKDRPYIPGSSIKGKLRSLLAKVEGSLFFSEKDQETEQKVVRELLRKDNPKIDVAKATKYGELIKKEGLNDEDYPYIMDLFGYSGDNDNAIGVHYTRLLVRDAFMDEAAWKADFSEDTEVTHGKWENVINRRTGTAEHPRQMERVPAGAKFNF
ncbi:MAG: type III-A CRISPR-associated RAMP protein Csm3, partial [Bacteroidota bacterium]